MTLWDFGGQDRFRFMLENYVAGCKGALLMFDLSRMETLEDINKRKGDQKSWLELLALAGDIPILLVGTKLDLVDTTSSNFKTNKIYIQKTFNELKEKGFIDCIYTSSKFDQNIDEAFKRLMNVVIEKEKK